jgi:gliding motility-associated-like protein
MILLLMSLSYCNADHFAGAELSYECLGTNGSNDSSLYDIKLIVYRDCAGVDFAPYYDILYQSLSCGIPFTQLRLLGGVREEITNLCPGDTSQCGDFTSNIHGLERKIYSAKIMLPHCNDWYFYWKNQNRNSAGLTNIADAGTLLFQPIFVEMRFDNSVYHCESFFDFTIGNFMEQDLCVGDTMVFDFMAAMGNSDGDSAIFTLVPPLTDGNGDSVFYELGYSYDYPITSNIGFSLDSITGVLTFAPTFLSSSIFAVKIQEYKNGVKIGESTRDMQLITNVCQNSRPTFNVSADTFFLCANKMFCKNIKGIDLDGDDVEVSVIQNGLPNDADVIELGNRVRMCWKPDSNSAGTYPLRLKVTDNSCPISLEEIKTYYISVPSDTGYQCICASADFEFSEACLGANTKFEGDASLSLGGTVLNWIWDFGDGNTGTGENPTHQYDSAGTFEVTVSFIDNIGCEKDFTRTVTICDVPEVDFEWSDTCEAPTRIFFEDITEYGCPEGNIRWIYSVGGTPTTNNYHEYYSPGTYDVTMVAQYADPFSTTKCIVSKTKQIPIYPAPTFIMTPSTHYQNCNPNFDTLFTVQFYDTAHDIQWGLHLGPLEGNDLFWHVEDSLGGKDDTLRLSTEIFTLNHDTLMDLAVGVSVTDSLGCYGWSQISIYDPLYPEFYNTPYCKQGDTITFTDITGSEARYLNYEFNRREWYFRDTASTDNYAYDSIVSHLFQNHGTYTINLKFFDSDSCYDVARKPPILVELPDNHFSVIAQDSTADSICFFQHSLIFDGPNERNAYVDSYTWYIDDATIDSIVIVKNDNYLRDPTLEQWFYYVNDLQVTADQLDSTRFEGKKFYHTYAEDDAGNKNLKLKMVYNTVRNSKFEKYDSLYCVKYFERQLLLRQPHLIDLIDLNHCLKDTIVYLATQNPLADEIVYWWWDFGDEVHTIALDTVYTTADTLFEFSTSDTNLQQYNYHEYDYPDLGRRLVNVRIVDIYGCEESTVEGFKIVRMDTLSIKPVGHCTNDVTVFPPVSFDRWQNIDLYRWEFGDTTVLSDTAYIVVNDDSTLRYNYLQEGWHTIWLEIQGSNHSCIDTLIDSLYIDAAPTALFQPFDSTCLGEPTLIVDLSHSNSVLNDTILDWTFRVEGDTLQYFWPDTSISFWHTFNNVGLNDSLYLRVESSNGCGDGYYRHVWVARKPNADFTFSPSLPVAGDEVTFTDDSEWFGEDIHLDSGYSWFIWDSNSVLIDQLVTGSTDIYNYLFEEEGIYFIDLIATNTHRCKDTARKEIDSYALLDFPTAFSPNGSGDNENDAFRLYYKGIKSLEEYKIYNRYGELVFDGGNDLNAEWDGNWRGKPQEIGNYVVVVRATDILDSAIIVKKNLVLVR